MFDFLIPKFKPRIIEEITVGNEVVAHIAGINLKPIEYENPLVLEEYIENILELNDKIYEGLFIEEIDKTHMNIRMEIEEKTLLKFPTGERIIYYNLPIIIDDIFKIIGREMHQEEVLLVVDNKYAAMDLINAISDIFNFISVFGLNEEDAEKIYEQVLDEKGISIVQPLNIEKALSNYGVIINQSNNLKFNLEKVKKKSIIFDFSSSKVFRNLDNHLAIEDIIIDIKDLDITKNNWIDKKITSDLYEALFHTDTMEYYQVSTKNGSYYIDEYINQGLKIKGKL